MKKNCVDESASCCEVWPTFARFAQKWETTVVSVAAPEAYLIQSVESVLLAIVALATDMVQWFKSVSQL